MSKITNERKNYQSRSKNIANSFGKQKTNVDIRKSREDFKVDCSGYFIWKSEEAQKNI
ncbi:hypothetical protein [Chromohalobacter moromii]|uniref:Uncharacterized protein n=1 Tax=Chromohalobacter moromii TaxID=2860329 RepID=A0A9X2X1W4_9GAMM|nr:hypothetical protein [Chromohalobacter moromii]MCK2046012.1 hypothetical protein [Chromohalobacter moromii]MCT8505564.1 hypothetical protein [Chromohalobacter moromii]